MDRIAGHFIVLTFHCCQFDCGHHRTAQRANMPFATTFRHMILTSFVSTWVCEPIRRTVWQLALCGDEKILQITSFIATKLHHHVVRCSLLLIECMMPIAADTMKNGIALVERSAIVIFWSIILRFIGVFVFVWFTLVSRGRIKITSTAATDPVHKKLLLLRTDRAVANQFDLLKCFRLAFMGSASAFVPNQAKANYIWIWTMWLFTQNHYRFNKVFYQSSSIAATINLH